MNTKMFKSIWLPIMVLTILAIFSSCQKEPIASFTVSSTSVNVGESVSFTNTSADADSYEWNFGDGNISASLSPTHTYNTAGTYTVTLTAFSKNGKKSDIATEEIIVIEDANLTCNSSYNNLSVTGTTVDISLRVENTGNGSAGSSYVGYYLSTNTTISTTDYKIGEDYVSSLSSGSYSNESIIKDLTTVTPGIPAGTYYVGYIIDYQDAVSESDENDNDYCFTVQVSTSVPNLTYNSSYNNLSVSGTTVDISLRIDNTGSGSAASSYVGYYLSTNTTISTSDYKIGDDYVSSLSSGSYSNESIIKDVATVTPSIPAGTYYVGYIIDYQNAVSESDENDNTYCWSSGPKVTVGVPPIANFTASPTSGPAPLTVNFTDQSANSPTSWSWSFSGGTPSSSTLQNPTVTYNTSGTYTVSLTATNAYGSDTKTINNYITVCSLPIANFSAAPTSIYEGGSVDFDDLSTNSPTSWSWNFGDGGTSTLQNPSHTYSNGVTYYTVSLTATNACGSDTETKDNYIFVDIWQCGDPFTDSRDGQTYQTVQIGAQCWMAKNLNYDAGSGSWCYNNSSSNCTTYGRLYNWNTALVVAPNGWHLPSNTDWDNLELSLGMSQADVDDTGWRGTDEGGKLKKTGTTYWSSPNTGATNASGFTALAAGNRHSDGTFDDLGDWTTFWTASQFSSTEAKFRTLWYNEARIYRWYQIKATGFSVRCVKD